MWKWRRPWWSLCDFENWWTVCSSNFLSLFIGWCFMWLGSGHKTSPVRRGSFDNILKVPSLYWMYDVNGQKCFISVSFWCWYLEMINYSLMVWGISTIFAHIPAWHWAARAESRSIPMSLILRRGLPIQSQARNNNLDSLDSECCTLRWIRSLRLHPNFTFTYCI